MMRFTADPQVVGRRVANFETLDANVGGVVDLPAYPTGQSTALDRR